MIIPRPVHSFASLARHTTALRTRTHRLVFPRSRRARSTRAGTSPSLAVHRAIHSSILPRIQFAEQINGKEERENQRELRQTRFKPEGVVTRSQHIEEDGPQRCRRWVRAPEEPSPARPSPARVSRFARENQVPREIARSPSPSRLLPTLQQEEEGLTSSARKTPVAGYRNASRRAEQVRAEEATEAHDREHRFETSLHRSFILPDKEEPRRAQQQQTSAPPSPTRHRQEHRQAHDRDERCRH